MAQKKFHSGENCPKSGVYSEYDASGKLINEDIDMEEGNRFPPSQEKNCYFTEQK